MPRECDVLRAERLIRAWPPCNRRHRRYLPAAPIDLRWAVQPKQPPNERQEEQEQVQWS